MGGGRELCVVELGEQLGDHSVHYSGFGLLGDMLRDQTKFQEEEDEDEEEVLANRLQKRSQQPTVIEARLPGYKPQEQKRRNVNLADSELQDNLAEEEERLQADERKSPIYMEISQQAKVEPFADSLDLLPLEVEVEVREDIMEQSMVYEGYVKSEGVYQGEGRLLFKNGDTYEGDWVEGAMEGKGVMRYADGDIYEGRWKCGLRDGMGEIVFQNGDYYRGHWTNDNMTDGFGKFTYPDGTVYLGEITGGSTMGKGKITFPAREEEWETEDFEEQLEKELERTANLMRPRKFKFYFRALIVVLVAVALMLIALFAWWLVYGI